MKDIEKLSDPNFLAARPDIVSGMSKIGIPSRTDRKPTRGFESKWINSVTSRWPVYRKVAIEWLAARPTFHEGVDLLLFDEKSLNEEFTLSKSEIRTMLKIKRKDDAMYTYRYFALGREIGKDVNQSAILSITRRELLQLYIATYARKYMNWQVQEGSFVRRTYSVRVQNDDEDGTFDRLDRLMKEKPEHGGPLMTVR